MMRGLARRLGAILMMARGSISTIIKGVFVAGLTVMGVAAFAQAPNLERMDIVLRSIPDGPVAKVEGVNIEGFTFVRFYEEELSRLVRDQGTGDISDPARAQLAMLCLRTLVERALLYTEALRRELTVPEESVQKAYAAQLAQVRKAAAARDNGELTDEGVLALLGYEEGEDMLADLRRALLTEKMRASLVRESGLTVSDEDVARVLENESPQFRRPLRLRFKQIYVNPEKHGSNEDETAKLAQEAMDRLYAGQSFEAVAKALSDSPDGVNGGDMGLAAVTQLPPFMVEAAEAMSPGDISEVIQSKYGYHIVMLVERAEAPEVSLETAGSLARRHLLTQEGTKVVREFCENLIENGSRVRVFLELDRNLALSRASSGEKQP